MPGIGRHKGRHAAERGLRSWLVPGAVPGGGVIVVGRPAGIMRGTLALTATAAGIRVRAPARAALWTAMGCSWPAVEILRFTHVLPGGWLPGLVSGGAATASCAGALTVLKVRQQHAWRATRGRALNPPAGYYAGRVTSQPDRMSDARERARQKVARRRAEMTSALNGGRELAARVDELEARIEEDAAWRESQELRIATLFQVMDAAGSPVPDSNPPDPRHGLRLVRDEDKAAG